MQHFRWFWKTTNRKNLGEEIWVFLEEGKMNEAARKFGDNQFLMKMSHLNNIFGKLNELNLQLQGRDKHLPHLADKISAFTPKRNGWKCVIMGVMHNDTTTASTLLWPKSPPAMIKKIISIQHLLKNSCNVCKCTVLSGILDESVHSSYVLLFLLLLFWFYLEGKNIVMERRLKKIIIRIIMNYYIMTVK